MKLEAAHVRLKRAHVPADADDGTRVLVDRLWPRGVRKADAAVDLWLKDFAAHDEQHNDAVVLRAVVLGRGV